MKKILITGANGFLGHNFADWFRNRYTVMTPRSGELNCIDAGAVQSFLVQFPADIIIHCASQGGMRCSVDHQNIIADNIAMVQNLLNAKSNNALLIVFGSGAGYNRFRHLHRVQEDEMGLCLPTEPYGIAKMNIAKTAEQRDDMLCLNIFGCYGKYELRTRFPSYAILQNSKDEDISINQNALFDYLYVEDLCKIVEFFFDNSPDKRVFNVTPNESVTLLEIAQQVNSISKYQSKIHVSTEKLSFAYTGDNNRLCEAMPKVEFTLLHEGLKRLAFERERERERAEDNSEINSILSEDI